MKNKTKKSFFLRFAQFSVIPIMKKIARFTNVQKNQLRNC